MTLIQLIESLFPVAITGLVSLGISYIAKISKRIEEMTSAIQILGVNLSNVDKVAQDHETRIRNLERRPLDD